MGWQKAACVRFRISAASHDSGGIDNQPTAGLRITKQVAADADGSMIPVAVPVHIFDARLHRLIDL
jgi:hypothetical protein